MPNPDPDIFPIFERTARTRTSTLLMTVQRRQIGCLFLLLLQSLPMQTKRWWGWNPFSDLNTILSYFNPSPPGGAPQSVPTTFLSLPCRVTMVAQKKSKNCKIKCFYKPFQPHHYYFYMHILQDQNKKNRYIHIDICSFIKTINSKYL